MDLREGQIVLLRKFAHLYDSGVPLTEALALEPEGMVRIGLLHYNTSDEVDRLLAALREWE